jgi:hypothetical protein
MSFKELEQKHNLINRVIVACGKHPTDADIHPLLEERLERFYEDATVEGMSMQMMRSVDRAVNAMAKPWVGLTDEEIDYIFGLAYADDMELLRTIEAKLKDKNG